MALPEDSAKVMGLSDLCFAYRRVHADSAELFGQAALRLARRLGFRRGEAQACNDLAILRIDRSAYEAADSLLYRSLALRKALGDPAGMAAVYNKLGITRQARFMLEDALEEDLKALAIYEQIGPPAHEATLLNNIAILQFNLNRFTEALATHKRAAAIRAGIPDSTGLAASFGNMANVELRLGDTANAVHHYQQAIGYFRAKDMRPELAVSLHNLASIRLEQGRAEEAARGHAEALELRRQLGEPKGIASSLVGLGAARLHQRRFTEAAALLHEGLAMGRVVHARNEAMHALLNLARLHGRSGRADSSLFFQEQYAALKDSVFNEDMSQRLAQAEARFETEKKERQIQAQRASIAELEREGEHRKLWLVTAWGGVAVVLLSALLLLQVQRRRARAQRDAAIIAERQAGLQGVLAAAEKERKRIAGELHDGIGQQVAGLKLNLEMLAAKADSGQPVPQRGLAEALSTLALVGQDVRGLAHALMPRALEEVGLVPAIGEMLERSFNAGSITCRWGHHGMDGRLPPEMETGLYRITQELVQNTLKHAQAKQVNVQLLRNNGHVVLIYEDDGRGLPAQGASTGIGLGNIQERARALNGTFTMANGPLHGILATVRIPLPGPGHSSGMAILQPSNTPHGNIAPHSPGDL